MEYKGYIAKIEFDDRANTFFGEVLNLRESITFEGDSVQSLKLAFHEKVESYLTHCEQCGETPDKPFSGKFMVRIDPALHRDVYMQAKLSGKSLNSWICNVLTKATADD